MCDFLETHSDMEYLLVGLQVMYGMHEVRFSRDLVLNDSRSHVPDVVLGLQRLLLLICHEVQLIQGSAHVKHNLLFFWVDVLKLLWFEVCLLEVIWEHEDTLVVLLD